MAHEIAKAIGTTVTHEWLITSAPNGTGLQSGTSQTLIAGSAVTIGGGIVIAVNETRITNADGLSPYVEECALPSQPVNAGIARNNEATFLLITLEKFPRQARRDSKVN